MNQGSKGSRIKVEYEGVLLRDIDDSKTVSIKDSADLFHCYDKDAVTITVLDPVNWPPVRGDVWKVQGRHYHYMGDLQLRMWASNARGYEYVSADYIKSRNPVLAFREGQ